MRPFLYAAISEQNGDALIFKVDREEVIIKNQSYWAFTCSELPNFLVVQPDRDFDCAGDLEAEYTTKEGYYRIFWLVRLSETKENSQEGWETARGRCS